MGSISTEKSASRRFHGTRHFQKLFPDNGQCGRTNCLPPCPCSTVPRADSRSTVHAFGDASGYAAIFAVITQDSGVMQGLVTTKSHLAKQGLTIPCLELVSGHMAANLVMNVHNTLEGFPLATNNQCWLDNTVALHWLNDNREYCQFVANHIRKIQSHSNLLWGHVPTTENPADLGSCGGSVTKAELWWRGPEWLADPTKRPPHIVTQATQESQAERKVQHELFAAMSKSVTTLITSSKSLGWIKP